jgi:hypothetical protein
VFLRTAVGKTAICLLLVATAATVVLRADGADGAAAPGAMLHGVVVDGAGGALSGVALTLINEAEGTQRQTITPRDGVFAFAMLAPGRYTLRADHINFAPAEIRDLDLDDRAPTTITIALQIARMRETVAVRGQASPFASSATLGAASVGSVLDRTIIARTPANGQSAQALIALTPGVITASGVMDAAGDFSVNGQRPSANYFTVDGVGANIANAVNAPTRASQASGGALPGVTTLGTTASLTPFEALEEVRVQTSSYAAEYGRQPGAQVSLVTRAGDSTWRGSFSTQIRNEAMNANDWFANRAGRSKLPLRQQQFGGMLGGPLALPHASAAPAQDHRTFFLIAHEHVNLWSPQILTTRVPTLAQREQAPSAMRPLLDAFPLPAGSPSTSPAPAPLPAPAPEPATPFLTDPADAVDLVGDDDARFRVDTTSVRVDHRLNNALSLFGRVNIAPSSSDTWKQTNLATRHSERLAARTITLAAAHQWRRTSTDIRINVSTNRGEIDEQQTNHLGAIPVPRAQLIPADLTGDLGRALVSFPVYELATTVNPPSLGYSASSTAQRQLNIVGTTTVMLDRHRVKVGVDVRRLQTWLRPRVYDLLTKFDNSYDIAASHPAAWLSTQPDELFPQFTNLSLFAQDTWIASSRLTVDTGVRWELNPPPGEANGKLPYTTLAPNAIPVVPAPAHTSLWRTDTRAFAPRLGVGWLLTRVPGFETMLRAGGGVFYDLGNTQATRGYDGFGYRSSTFLLVTVPFEPSNLSARPGPPQSILTVPMFAFDRRLRLPYTGQWNLSIEQALGATRSLTVSYVGAGGRQQLAQLHATGVKGPVSASFEPGVGVYLTTNDGTSNYHALQSQFQQRLSSRFWVSASHTWSHTIDRVSVENRDEAVSTLARGDADFDVRHVVSAAAGYEVPGVRGSMLGRALLDGWSVDGRFFLQTARPLNIIKQTVTDQLGQERTVWAYRVGVVPLYLDSPEAPGGRRINADAFQTLGTGLEESGRNVVRGLGAWQVDLALRRVFTIGGARLAFQATAFNALNHPNFGRIDETLGSPTFGSARAMLGRTLGGLNPSYQIGGPRTIELSLRASF